MPRAEPCPSGSKRPSTSAGEAVARKAARGHALLGAGTAAPIARPRPTGRADMARALWWGGERWAAAGPFGVATMPVGKALGPIAIEPAFRIHAEPPPPPKTAKAQPRPTYMPDDLDLLAIGAMGDATATTVLAAIGAGS